MLEQLPPSPIAHLRRAFGRSYDINEEDRGEDTVVLRRIFDSRKPVIAAINGPAVGLGLTVTLAMDVRMGDSVPAGFVEEFTDTVNKRRFKEAYDLAKNDTSFLARVLTAGMSRLQYGIEDARETAMNTVESIRAGKGGP